MNFKKLSYLAILLPLHAYSFEIYPQVSSAIIEIKNIGDKVSAGNIIIKLDNRKAKLELEYLQILQSIRQRDFDDKQLEFKQTEELYDRMVASHRDLDIAKAAFDKSKRELDAHNIKIKIAQIELDKYTIITPISGEVIATPNLRNVTNARMPKILMIIQ